MQARVGVVGSDLEEGRTWAKHGQYGTIRGIGTRGRPLKHRRPGRLPGARNDDALRSPPVRESVNAPMLIEMEELTQSHLDTGCPDPLQKQTNGP